LDRTLVIIDMQMVMQDRIDGGRPHVNPDAPDRVAALIAAVRAGGGRVIHVRHADNDPASPLHPGAAGHAAMPCARERDGEAVFVKRSSSAFATTDLAAHLHAAGIAHIHVAGAVAGFCVNSTVRAAADLGFGVSVIADAVLGFDLPDAKLDARTIFDVTMALLAADFATLTDTATVIGALPATR
jgi:nicotinamidase-related amidase